MARRLVPAAALGLLLLAAPLVHPPTPVVHVDGGNLPPRAAQEAPETIPPDEVRACLVAYGWAPGAADAEARCPVWLRTDLAPPVAGLYWLPPVDRTEVAAWTTPAACPAIEHELHHRRDALAGLWDTWNDGLPTLYADPVLGEDAWAIVDQHPGDGPHWNHQLAARLGHDYRAFPPLYRARWFAYASVPERVFLPALPGGPG